MSKWSKIKAMKTAYRALLLSATLLVTLLLCGACEKHIPDVAFGGSHAVYEIGEDQMVDPYEFLFSTEVLETPEEPTKIVEPEKDSAPKQTDALKTNPTTIPTQETDPNSTPAPTVNPLNEKEAFYAFWSGDWAFWFESNGKLLEGKIGFDKSEDGMVGKTEIEGELYTFTIAYTKGQDFYKDFVYGTWLRDGMQDGTPFRLKALNEKQVGGFHSRPSKTFCMARDGSQRPDPCFIPLPD